MSAVQLTAVIFAIVMVGLFVAAVWRKYEKNRAEDIAKLRRHCDEQEPSLVGRPYGATNYQGIQIMSSDAVPPDKMLVLTPELVAKALDSLGDDFNTPPRITVLAAGPADEVCEKVEQMIRERTRDGVQFLFNFDNTGEVKV